MLAVAATARHNRAPATPADFDALIMSRFAGQRGWFCLGHIDGDPSLEKLTQEWYFLPRQRAELAARCAELADRRLNLYWAACLFSARKRSYKNAQPTPWLWMDDAPADIVCSELVHTSEQSYQALVKLDRAIGADERKRLQAAWRDRHGGDACSSDAVHMMRMPGGYNRKRHGCYLVHVARSSNQVWSADRLLARLPQVEPKPSAGPAAELDWPEVETHLANIDALLSSARARCIKPDSQTGRILAGERVAIASAKLGRMDDSYSAQAAILAYGFYCRGFTDAEIGAVVYHFYQQWGVVARKGSAWAKADIERCIALAHEKKPGVLQTATRYRAAAARQPIAEQPAASRAREDRPRRLDPFLLFARYKADPVLCALKRKERAAQLEISTATLDRFDDTLETLGLIEIEILPKRAGSRVILQGGVINIPPAEVLSDPPIDTPSATAFSAPECGEPAFLGPQCIGETHTPPDTAAPPQPPARRLSLAERVRQAFDLVKVDQDTGEKQRATRRRLYIALGPLTWSDRAIDAAIDEERERRRIEAIVFDIGQLRLNALKSQIRLMEHLAEKSRRDGTNLYKYAEWAAREMKAELATRPAEPGRRARVVCEVLPDARQAGELQQAELLDFADEALADLRAQRQGRPRGGVCSPQPTTAMPPAAFV